MKPKTFIKLGLPGVALFLQIWFAQDAGQAVPASAPPAQGRGGINRAPDPRVQQRMYHFHDTNEDLPYAIFVSSKVTKDQKAPLIIALHGLGGDQNSLMRGNAVDL